MNVSEYARAFAYIYCYIQYIIVYISHFLYYAVNFLVFIRLQSNNQISRESIEGKENAARTTNLALMTNKIVRMVEICMRLLKL